MDLEQKTNRVWRYLVLPEIALGLASYSSVAGVELLTGLEDPPGYSVLSNSEYRVVRTGVRQRGISSVVERETARTVGQGPKAHAKC